MKLTINEIKLLQEALRMTMRNSSHELHEKLNTELGLMYAENEIAKFKEINKALRDGFKDLCKTFREQQGKETKDARGIPRMTNPPEAPKQRPNTTSSFECFTKDEYHNLKKDTLDDLIRDIHLISAIEVSKNDLGLKESITIVVNSDSGLKEEERKRLIRYCFENKYFYLKMI